MGVTIKLCKSCHRPAPKPASTDDAEGPQPGRAWAFVGMTGTGKSHLLKDFVGQWMKRRRPIVYWDTHREMSQAGLDRPLAPRGPLLQELTVRDFLADPERALLREDLALAIVPTDADKPKETGEEFCEVMPYIKARGNCILGITEGGAFLPQSAGAADLCDVIATGWRKEGIALAMDFQFLVQVPPGTRAQLCRYYLFRQAKAAHRQLVAQETTAEIAKQVRRLGVGEYVVYDVWGDPDEDDEEEGERKAA